MSLDLYAFVYALDTVDYVLVDANQNMFKLYNLCSIGKFARFGKHRKDAQTEFVNMFELYNAI